MAAKVAPVDLEWSRAFATQAISDLEARELLGESGAAFCHELHYLQMAAEKVCKSHLHRTPGYGPSRSHQVVEKTLPTLAKQFNPEIKQSNSSALKAKIRAVRKFGAEIDSLAPAVTQGGSRQDNTEYPWIDTRNKVRTPCLHDFEVFRGDVRRITEIVKLLKTAAENYAH